jgi:hypothetical protein
MPSNYKRRDFIKNLMLYGVSFEVVPGRSLNNLFSENQQTLIENDFFSISFNSKSGRINVLREDGSILLDQVTARINLLTGKRSIADQEYNHRVNIQKVNDKIGTGRQLIINSKDKEGKTELRVSYILYDKLNSIIIEAGCRNISPLPLGIKSIEPICAIEEVGASLHWPSAGKAITNGPMYYDAGMIYNFGDIYQEPDPYGPIKGGKLSPDFSYPSGDRIRSWWNVGIFSGYNKECLVCGFLENNTGLGQIILSKNNRGMLSLYTESVFAEGTELNPGQAISSGRFIINIAKDPYTALEEYAGIMGLINNSRVKSIVNGWCNWFYTYEFVTEEEIVRNAEYASHYLKQYGLEYIQIDEGYQKYHGDWEGNDRFPHGMKWLADKIKGYGLKPGLWLAPYVISEPTEIFRNHSDWLLKQADGQLMRVGPWPGENTDWARNEVPKRYGLDISHPESQKWLYNLFDTAANSWGYEMFKIDFVAWSLLSAHHFFDNTYTPAMAYRKGLQIIRSAIGNEKHINDCGPGPVSVGLIDSMRIEVDQNYGFSSAAWKQYFLDSSSSAPAAAKRYYFNKRTWINDADHICINLLSIPQAKAAASLISLSGGNVISGDRLIDLDISRLEILKKIFPSYGEAARPVDLFDSDRHSVFSLNIKKTFAEWTVVGVFNSSETEVLHKTIPLNRLWLDPGKTYIGYDFWMERLSGEVTQNLEVKVLPLSVTLLSLHMKKDIPQFISTDRHILQGAIEMEDVHWDAAAKTLEAISLGAPRTAYNVMIYLPEGIKWEQGNRALYKDFENYSVKLADQQLLRVRLNFGENERLSWKIPFSEFLR